MSAAEAGVNGVTDEVDQRLVKALSRDGRASVRTIAREVGVSESTARVRLGGLFDSGLVAVHAMVHPSVYGQQIIYQTLIESCGGSTPSIDDVDCLDAAGWICRFTDGRGLMVQQAATTVDDITEFVGALSEEPWVDRVTTSVAFRLYAAGVGSSVLHTAPGPWPAPPARTLDSVDRQLLEVLRFDGRCSYTMMARSVDLSVPATRRRVVKLAESGAVRFVTVLGERPDDSAWALVMIGAPARAYGSVVDELMATPGVNYVSEMTHELPIWCDVRATDQAGLDHAGDVIRQIDGVSSVVLRPFEVLRNRNEWSAYFAPRSQQ